MNFFRSPQAAYLLIGIAFLALAAGLFYQTSQQTHLDACIEREAGSTSQASCWADSIRKTLERRGIDAAFAEFSRFHREDVAFAGNCHDVGHILGWAAYEAYRDDPDALISRRETSYCGFGFYHGFMESMLAEHGQDFSIARDYCEAVGQSPTLGFAPARGAMAACFHGVGHALFDSLPSSLWGNDSKMVETAERECEQLSTDPDKRRWCMSGVMNSLVNAYQAYSYDLSFRAPNPTTICTEQIPLYQEVCRKEVIVQYLNNQKFTFEEGIAFVRANRGSPEDEVMFSYVDNVVRHAEIPMTPAEIHGLCASAFAGAPRDLTSCIDGSLYALATAGEPGREYGPMFTFCALWGEERASCFTKAGDLLRTLHPFDTVRSYCNELPLGDAAACNTTDNL